MLPDQGPGIKLENSMNSVVKIKVICWEIKATKYAHERENAARARNGYAGDVGFFFFFFESYSIRGLLGPSG